MVNSISPTKKRSSSTGCLTMNSKMANNTIHHETQSVVPGACGLIGLVVVMVFIVWLIRFLAHEGRLSDPQRALIVEESGTSTVGAEARSDSDDGIPIRWIRVPRGYRLPQKSKKVNPLAEVLVFPRQERKPRSQNPTARAF